MNKILLVAHGEFNVDKLIGALQNMVLDSDNEKIVAIYGQNFNIHESDRFDGDIDYKDSVFMGQIVDKNTNDFPYIFKHTGRTRTWDFWVSGIIDKDQVLKSKLIDKVVLEQDKETIRNNPNLLVEYLHFIKNREYKMTDHVNQYLNEYNIDSIYSIFDFDTVSPLFRVCTTGDTICYYGGNDKVTYMSNSGEVLNSIGVKNFPVKDFSYNHGYWVYGHGSYGWTNVDPKGTDLPKFHSKEDVKSSEFEKSLLLVTDERQKEQLLAIYNNAKNNPKDFAKKAEVHVFTYKK